MLLLLSCTLLFYLELMCVWLVFQGDADGALDRLWQKKRVELRQ